MLTGHDLCFAYICMPSHSLITDKGVLHSLRYWLMCAGDEMIATNTSTVGSIGTDPSRFAAMLCC